MMAMTRTGWRHGNESPASRLRDALVARLHPSDGERGAALLSAMIFMIIMAGLSVVVLSTVLSQTVPSVAAQRNTKTVYAAQAGMQASFAMLRSAAATPDSDGNVYGSLSKLKCSVTGQVDAQANGLNYSATIKYYASNPSTNPVPPEIPCSALGVSSQPRYALITSSGTVAAGAGSGTAVTGDRAISAVYAFKITNVNIPGGRIFDQNNAVCLEAVPLSSGSIGVGSFIRFVAAASCTSSATNDAKQLWVYATDYEIKLASTIGTATPLCITGPVNYGDSTQDATLQKCRTDSTRWNQLWSWTGDYTWQGQNPSISSGTSGYYIGGPIAAGNRLKVRTDHNNGTFNPASAVGAGAASVNTIQIVNYLQFGRCLDVTSEDINSSFMIAYPCKQDPSGTGTPAGTGKLAWNHKWYYNEPTAPATSLTQSIYVYDGSGTKKCLTTSTASSGPLYPTFSSCSGSNSLQKWTRIVIPTDYLNSYWFKDSLGRCLSVGNSNDLYNGWSKIVVTACDGSLAQKWNAPAEVTKATVGGYKEVYNQ
jgi:Tfp pilus assembly protein PilX